ncbi:MAG: choice-of-anchor D domain-containing protein [Anaerolineaceae bacterium]|nr:choice-of-anchor D domain-containing protein [Anaerolineaceae bacterium]
MNIHRPWLLRFFKFSLSAVLFTSILFSSFAHVTAQVEKNGLRSDTGSLVVTNATEVVNGNIANPTELIAYPGADGISLPEAIAATNNTSEYYTITFDPSLSGSTISLTVDMPHITQGNVTIIGDINEDGTPDITIDGTHGQFCGFNITGASNVVIRGFNIHNFPKHGIYIRPDTGEGKTDVENIVIHQNDITASEGAISLMITGQSNSSISNVEISSNNLHDSPGGALSIHAGMGENSNYNQISNVSIISNRIDNPSVTIDIMISPASSSNISNNTISNIVILGNSITSYNDSSILVDASNQASCNNNTMDGLLIAENTIEGQIVVIELVTESGIYSTGNLMTNVTIRDNVLLGGGIHIAGSTGMNAQGNTISNLLFERNVIDAGSVTTANGIYVTAGSGGAYNNTLQNFILRDNFIKGFRDTGILLRGDYSTSPNNTIDNVSILNQTLIGNGLTSSWSAGGINVDSKYSGNTITNVTIKNSVFWGNNLDDAIGGATDPGTVENNLINDVRYTSSNGNFYDDPEFVDSPSGNYRLLSSSPCIDVGDSIASGVGAKDLDGKVRVVDGDGDTNAVIDLGAWEYNAGAIQNIAVENSGVSILNGDLIPVPWDGTNFGNAEIGGASVQHTFTIENTGDAQLGLTGTSLVEITGENADDFTVTTQPANAINGGATTTFTIAFSPSASGLRSAAVSIMSNDPDDDEFTFAIQGFGDEPPAEQEIDVSGNSVSILDNDTTPSTADGTDFGTAVIGGASAQTTFTIRNTGDETLTLTGTEPVEITGAHASDFSVTSQPAASIAGGQSDTFTIEFSPQDSGTREATVKILSNDSDEAEFTFAIQGVGNQPQEISVSGKGVVIYDGDISPSTTDGTDFGNAEVGGAPVQSTFSIENVGDEPLMLIGTNPIILLGEYAGDYAIVSQPSSTTINGGQSVTFTVEFSPDGTGARGAMVRIMNDDSDEGQFSFTITGFGVEQASDQEISVSGNGIPISQGDNSPSTLDGTDFGEVEVGGDSVQVIFTIQNIGGSALELTGSPLIEITGTNAGDFSVIAQPASTINGGSSTTFTVSFSPSGLGYRGAQIHIPNNDADEGGFYFAIQGFGIEETGGDEYYNFLPLIILANH